MSGRDGWTTPRDLAEYTFCPRAHYYRQHGESPASPASIAGETFHRTTLGAERWREEHGRLAWGAVVAGVGFLALAVALVLR